MAPAPPPAARALLLLQALWPGTVGVAMVRKPPTFSSCIKGCSPEECGKPRWSDLDRPMVEVLRDQPGLNGYCYFYQFGAWWFEGVHQVEKTRDLGPTLINDRLAAHQRAFRMPATLTYDGDTHVTTHLFPGYMGSAYDVPYCYALGWLKGQRLNGSVAHDFDAWHDRAKAECARLQQLEGFRDEDFTFKYHRDNRAPTTTDFRAHVYGKCLLGTVGVAMEMAWCHFGIGCLIGDSYVGHGSECH